MSEEIMFTYCSYLQEVRVLGVTELLLRISIHISAKI